MSGTTKVGREDKAREEALLLAAGQGDVDALRQLYRIFERPLYTLGNRWLGDPKLAEDLVQEVTLRIWRGAATYDPARGAASSWIFGIARNVSLDLVRARNRAPIPVAEPRTEGPAPWDEDAAWQAWQVAKAVRHLSLDQQKIIELAYVKQFTQSEIARTLGVPLGTIKTRLYQALKKLKVELADMGIVEAEGS